VATSSAPHVDVVVDLDAIRDNVATLKARSRPGTVMAVVKADAYGHGLVPSARAAAAGGATWLATATLHEAVALRAAGLGGRILCWLSAPGERWQDALAADVDVAAYAPWAVEEIAAAAAGVGRPARLHLKVDTGLGRGGATPADWPALVDAALAAQGDGTVAVVGLFTHFAHADAPDHPVVHQQAAVFAAAVAWAEARGVRPEVRHLANSAATLCYPDTHWDVVRPGLAVFGLSPVPDLGSPADFGLRPAMTVTARLSLVKRVPAGHGVSYGHEYVTDRETSLALVPMGYADGLPRAAGGAAPVEVAGVRRTVAGRMCMDQFVLDVADDDVRAGDEVVLLGPGDHGEPTAEDWARATGTISYEIVTRMAPRVPRRYVGGEPGWAT
jgi:alanine racemase